MLSKKEEERNEKIIRGLMKLPPNRTCMNCNSLGPQYVCTNFWTFVCITCSGIHREFTHRVKSVSMAKFTSNEVQSLQKGGNQLARDIFLKYWDKQLMQFPNRSIAEIREFIRNVYVHKKYSVERAYEKRLRDIEINNQGEDGMSTSSYHSCSHTPLYEHRHEGSGIGKSSLIMLLDANQEIYGRTGTRSVYGAQHLHDNMNDDDKFANENASCVFLDYSVSSVGDPFRYDSQSSNFQDSGYNSPSLLKSRDHSSIGNAQPRVSDRYSEENVKRDFDRCPCQKRTISSGYESNASSPESFQSTVESFRSASESIRSASESFRSASESFRFTSPTILMCDAVEDKKTTGGQKTLVSATPLPSQSSTSGHVNNQDFVNVPSMQPINLPPSVDLIGDIFDCPSFAIPSEKNHFVVPFSGSEEWATFDVDEPVGNICQTNKEAVPMVPLGNEASEVTEKPWASMHNSEWYSFQNSKTGGPFTSTSNQLDMDLKPWHTFDDSSGNSPHIMFGSLQQNNQSHIQVYTSPTCNNPDIRFENLPYPFNKGFQTSSLDGMALGLPSPPTSISIPSVLPPMAEAVHARKSRNPFDLPYELDSEINNEFPDMSSLQATMPFLEVPSFLDVPPQQWLPQTLISQGGLAYMGSQGPSSTLNPPPQGYTASRPGNPFA